MNALLAITCAVQTATALTPTAHTNVAVRMAMLAMGVYVTMWMNAGIVQRAILIRIVLTMLADSTVYVPLVLHVLTVSVKTLMNVMTIHVMKMHRAKISPAHSRVNVTMDLSDQVRVVLIETSVAPGRMHVTKKLHATINQVDMTVNVTKDLRAMDMHVMMSMSVLRHHVARTQNV